MVALNGKTPSLAARLKQGLAQNARWLYWGLGIKRWLLLLFLGTALIGLGVAYLLVQVYREFGFPELAYYLTLQFIPRVWRGVLFFALGVGSILFALVKLQQTVVAAIAPGQPNLLDGLYRRRTRTRGLKVVALGGGTGLSTLLRGLKEYTENVTAIVTVADDGGSSGRLRQELGLLPPGDFRQCIAALAEAEPLMTSLFEYRFGRGGSLGGHAFGNLFIAAMAGVTGNFERALAESSRVLAVRGEILPSTLENVILGAELQTGDSSTFSRVEGESRLAKLGAPIVRVYLQPETPRAYPGAVRAILEADLVIAGPGSLYTSVLPNLLVPDIANALRASPAARLYVCNIATERGETDGLSAEAHAAALERHIGGRDFSAVLVNDNFKGRLPLEAGIEYVRIQGQGGMPGYTVRRADVVDEHYPWRHDPHKLAREIMNWYGERKKLAIRTLESQSGSAELPQSIAA